MKSILKTLAMVVVLFPQCASSDESPANEFFVWGFDRLAVGSLNGPSESLRDFIAPGTLTNIVSVSRSKDRLAVVAKTAHSSQPGELSLVTLGLHDPANRKTFEMPGLIRAALSPGGDVVAMTICHGGGCDVVALDVTTEKSRVIVSAEVAPGGTVAWHPSGDKLAFESTDGATTVVVISDGEKTRIEGSAPAWTPDGAFLALVRGKEIVTYNLASHEASVLVRRHIWQSGFVGPLYWNNDGSILLASVPSGFFGYDIECLSVNKKTLTTRKAYSGSLFCGPWLR